MKAKPVIMLLAFACVFFALLLPPEAYPNGKLGVVLCASFAFLSCLAERHIPSSFLKAGAWLFGLLLIHTFLFSIDFYRSLDTLTAIWAYYCVIGVFIYASAGYEDQLALVMVALTLILSGYGIYQYFWGFDKVYSYIFYAGADEIIKTPALQLIANRRVSSTLALPGTLWGFLVCALPFHAMLWGRRSILNVVVLISGIMALVSGFLTRSFGFLFGLLILVVGVLWMRHRKLLWNRLTPVLGLLIVLAVVFYSSRHGAIENANPAGLRLLNWVTAWNIFAVHPLGTGLNTFGIAYSEYMLPHANETQFVHNTLLQLLSELGLPLIVLVIAVLILKANSLQRLREWQKPGAAFLLLALIVWLAHNLVDIDVYFPSVGVLGAVIIGALFSREHRRTELSTPQMALTGVVTLVVLAFAAVSCISTELQYRAQIEYENKKPVLAVATLADAQRLCPINSSLYHDSGEILLELYHNTHQLHYLTEATEAFRTSIRLSPRKAGSYVGYGLTLSSANHLREALDQIRIAQTLYPASPQADAIAHLIGQRLQ